MSKELRSSAELVRITKIQMLARRSPLSVSDSRVEHESQAYHPSIPNQRQCPRGASI